MSWETAWAVSIFATVWVLVSAAKQFKSDENDDNLSSSLKSLFKTVFIGTALILSVVAIGNVENVVLASITPGNTTLVDNFVAGNAALYRGALNTYIIFIFFLLLFIIFMVFRNLRRNPSGP